MTPQEFIAKWQPVTLSERSACQQHFLDLCDLLDQPKPAAADPEGAWYTFERGVKKTEGGQGWADVWMKGKFGWEYKGKHKDLKVAYQQLLKYRNALENPPLLVVCDMDRFEVHTNFTGTAEAVHAFDLDGLADPKNWIFSGRSSPTTSCVTGCRLLPCSGHIPHSSGVRHAKASVDGRHPEERGSAVCGTRIHASGTNHLRCHGR